jgi:hypothetical protein
MQTNYKKTLKIDNTNVENIFILPTYLSTPTTLKED